MSEKVDINEAETRLSQLVTRVAAGDEIIIMRDGRPVARLVPFRRPGRMRGRVRIGRDFDAPPR